MYQTATCQTVTLEYEVVCFNSTIVKTTEKVKTTKKAEMVFKVLSAHFTTSVLSCQRQFKILRRFL